MNKILFVERLRRLESFRRARVLFRTLELSENFNMMTFENDRQETEAGFALLDNSYKDMSYSTWERKRNTGSCILIFLVVFLMMQLVSVSTAAIESEFLVASADAIPDSMTPESLAYYEKRGITKKTHYFRRPGASTTKKNSN